MSLFERFKTDIEELRFCYAKEGGQGFTHKSECTCDKINNPCQAIKDADRFHEVFKTIKYDDIETRDKVIQEIKPKFQESQWWKDNVVE